MHAGGAGGAGGAPSCAQVMDALTHVLFVVCLLGIAHAHGMRAVLVVLCLLAMAMGLAMARDIKYTEPDADVKKLVWLVFMAVFGLVPFFFDLQACNLCLKKGTPTAKAVARHVEEHVLCMNIAIGMHGQDTNLAWSWTPDGGRQKKYVKCLTDFSPGWNDCDMKKVTDEVLSCKTT